MDISQRTRQQQQQQVSPRKSSLCSYSKYMTYYAAPPRGDDNKGKFKLDACFCIIHVAHAYGVNAHGMAMLPMRLFHLTFCLVHLFSTYLRATQPVQESVSPYVTMALARSAKVSQQKTYEGKSNTAYMQNAHISHACSNCWACRRVVVRWCIIALDFEKCSSERERKCHAIIALCLLCAFQFSIFSFSQT